MLVDYKDLSFYARIMELRETFAKRQVAGTGAGRVSRRENDSFKEEDFEFIQLSDFLPEAEIRCKELGLIPVVCIEGNIAIMTVYDEVSDKSVRFTTPTCSIRTNTNGQALQAIGSQISYSRRYLWYLFLDLCTHDELDEGRYDAGLQQKLPTAKPPVMETVAPAATMTPVQNQAPAQVPPQKQAPGQVQSPSRVQTPVQTEAPARVQAPAQTQVPPKAQAPAQTPSQAPQMPPKQAQAPKANASGAGRWPVPPIHPHPNYPYLDITFYNAVDSSPRNTLINTIRGGKIDASRYEKETGTKIESMPDETLKKIIFVNVNERNRHQIANMS